MKFTTSNSFFSLYTLLLVFLMPPVLAAGQLITFETLPAPASGTGGYTLANQLPDATFNFQTALDYGTTPGFTHSGTKALEVCYGKEFCGGQLEVTFAATQHHVKIWVGYDNSLTTAQPVILKAFDINKNLVGQSTVVLGASTSRIPIQNALEVNTSGEIIKSITAGFVNAHDAIIFNNDLVFDDLEYNKTGAAAACPVAGSSSVILNAPVAGSVFLKNLFNLDADITTSYAFASYPFSTMQLTTTDASGNTKSFGPTFLTSFNWHVNGLTNFLLPGENKLTAMFTDCQRSSEVSTTVFFRPDVTSSFIHVIDKDGADVPGAEVYADKLLGLTDNTGRLTVQPPLAEGTPLVARKLVYINGTNFNFEHKVYQTSMSVQNNGVVNRHIFSLAPDPNAVHELQVLPTNSLTAFSFTTSVEWDASDAELNDIRDHFIRASEFMYNATDGQFIIERVNIEDDKVNWHEPDYRIYGNQSLRSNTVDGWDFADADWDHFIEMARPQQVGVDVPTGYSLDRTYIHEFGHYRFGLGDEYRDGTSGTTWCTSALFAPAASPVSPFAGFSKSAACIMSYQYSAPKYCSTRPENPHISGTRQGSASCWSDIARVYKDSQSPQRWIIQSPETRGAIPGAINGEILPVSGWTTKFNILNHDKGPLCAPVVIFVTDNSNNLIPDKEIWLSTTYGQDLHEGNTGETDGAGIWCTGVHAGDNFGNLTITDAGCAPLPSPIVMHIGGGDTTIQPGTRAIGLVMSPAALGVKMSISPLGMAGKYQIQVRMDSTEEKIRKAKLPVLLISLGDSLKEIRVPLVYNVKTKEYSGVTKNLPIIPEGKIKLVFQDSDKSNTSIESFVISPVRPRRSMKLSSANGKVILELISGALPEKSRVVIGPSIISAPVLNPGTHVIMKPVNIDAGNNNLLKKQAIITFYLPGTNYRQQKSDMDNKSFQLLHFNPAIKKWENANSTLVAFPTGVLVCKTYKLGVFAIISPRPDK